MTAYTFKGRFKPKQEKPNMLQLVELPHKRTAFVYQRLSSHEQVKKSIFSLQMQDSLEDLAKEDGYKTTLSKEQVQAIRDDPDYLGYYLNGKIIVEQRDLGISGTLGPERREGLAHLIQMIETDVIESIYVVHISRLFRDQTLIDGLSFGELCKKHGVVIVMPNMRLNLNDKMHMRIYRMELERSADELEIMNLRMGGARQLKAKQGYFASGSVPIGFILERDKSKNSYDKYVVYEPHAEIIRRIFQLLPEMNYSPIRVAKTMQRDGIYIPPFPPELKFMETRSGAKKMIRTDMGYKIVWTFVSRAVTNPAYIGWWVYGGEILSKDNHSKIVDEDLFWFIQERLQARAKTKGRGVYSEPLILKGILYCEEHEPAKPLQVHIYHDDKRYRCQGQYYSDATGEYHFSVDGNVLDEPISEFIISQCSYPNYAEKIIQQLKNGYNDAKTKAESNRRELARLTAEIETLKENIAHTKTPQQIEMIFEMIETKQKQKEKLSSVSAYPAGRVGSAIKIEKVKKLLTNLRVVWDSQSNTFKNEFLTILLNKILVRVSRSEIKARILWKTGLEQEILIERPPYRRGKDNLWSKEEREVMQKYFPTAPWGELLRMIPNRTYNNIQDYADKHQLRRMAKESPKRRRPWTGEEDKQLEKVSSGQIRFEDLMMMLNRSPYDINTRQKELHLRKADQPRPDRIVWKVVDLGDGPQNRCSDTAQKQSQPARQDRRRKPPETNSD